MKIYMYLPLMPPLEIILFFYLKAGGKRIISIESVLEKCIFPEYLVIKSFDVNSDYSEIIFTAFRVSDACYVTGKAHIDGTIFELTENPTQTDRRIVCSLN